MDRPAQRRALEPPLSHDTFAFASQSSFSVSNSPQPPTLLSHVLQCPNCEIQDRYHHALFLSQKLGIGRPCVSTSPDGHRCAFVPSFSMRMCVCHSSPRTERNRRADLSLTTRQSSSSHLLTWNTTCALLSLISHTHTQRISHAVTYQQQQTQDVFLDTPNQTGRSPPFPHEIGAASFPPFPPF